MKNKVKVAVETQNDIPEATCHHFWIIESANGPKSLGTCKYCGERRDFFNSAPEETAVKQRNHPLGLPKIAGVELGTNSQS
jgi:hypothetical protein